MTQKNDQIHWIFRSDNPHGNVVFNFTSDNAIDLKAFAKGYHISGKRLAQILLNRRGYGDYEGYPILFLYRHSFELYLKALIYQGALLLKVINNDSIDIKKFFSCHKLSKFIPVMEPIFNLIDGIWDTNVKGMRDYVEFEELINAINKIDPRSSNFRYPIDRNGKPDFEHHTVINAIAFSNNMDPILDNLDTLVFALGMEFDEALDAKYKLQQFMKEFE